MADEILSDYPPSEGMDRFHRALQVVAGASKRRRKADRNHGRKRKQSR